MTQNRSITSYRDDRKKSTLADSKCYFEEREKSPFSKQIPPFGRDDKSG
jgi:hypothetical protein